MFKSLYIKYIQKAYRSLVPLRLRKKVEFLLFGVSTERLKRKIIRFLRKVPQNDITEEEKDVLEFLENNPLQIFPYEFTKHYSPKDHEVYLDNELGLHYVLFEGKKLYFKRSWGIERIQTVYNNLLIEQNPNSPHCYLNEDFELEDNSIIADIGVAEGNFALSVIEKAKKIYLFESDEEWIEALNATFSSWKDKVVIVNKWVSDVNNDIYVTLDSYFKDICVDFIKVDVDGFERKLIKGSASIIKNNNTLKVVLCTYHNQDDQIEFYEFFKANSFDVSYSKGYMIFWWGKIKKPYLRRGLIRATKK